ncbi:AAA family ATPase [Nonomuraea sp. CA-218870]|uniref:AAA family ATPase n=1 Tax=Nonomuraea sp. CA-218870 TaxID=3239998 RepID=UPI003D93DDAC
MRPLLLRLDHFGSFRDPVEVDFSDVDYFALTGPTGAGKSTIIDALCFALYGTVPRWGRENVIAHALAPSVAAGKVALLFESDGRRYGVVRALVRDGKGTVRTKEARIDELAGGAPLDEAWEAVVRPLAEGEHVTAEVQRVTGLEYRFFTQCVVLPQGRFAEFLHAAPRERQDLLVQLLDADVYEAIRQRAVREEETARSAASLARDQLAKLSGATAELEAELAERLSALRRLAGTLDADLDLLRAREADIRRATQERAAVVERQAALAGPRMPDGVETLATARRAAAEAAASLLDQVAALEADEHAADEALAALGGRDRPQAALAALDSRDRLTAQAESARAQARSAAESLASLRSALQDADSAMAEAERLRDRLRDAHAAADLASRLAPGDPCPVCLRPVDSPRAAGRPEQTRDGRTGHAHPGSGPAARAPGAAEIRAAEGALAAARKEAERARTAYAKAETSAGLYSTQVAKLEAELAALPPAVDRAAAEGRLAAITKAEEVAAEARAAARSARSRLRQAQTDAERADQRAAEAWRTLETARDRLLALGSHDDPPPPLARDDLHRAWTDLLAWRDRAARAAAAALAERDEALAVAGAGLSRERARLAERLREHQVPLPGEGTPDQLGAAVAGEVARVESRLERVREARERAAELAEEAAGKEHAAKVAHELALRLRANAFERWLCAEALDVLVTTASGLLKELSDGQYELALSDRTEIEVIDHAEAGLRRSARTLSGGETFQAALALALALSDAVARGLDSIFLDEGFGTLDPATLDTVATTLERLAAGQERMVGVVTHVPALAERVPVRFEVSRDAKGSHVRKAGL